MTRERSIVDIRTREAEAREVAEALRATGRGVRLYPRCVRAENKTMLVWVIVADTKAPGQ